MHKRAASLQYILFLRIWDDFWHFVCFSRVLPNETVHCRPSAGLRPHAVLSIKAHSPRSKINREGQFYVVCAGPQSMLSLELTAKFSDDKD